MGDIPRGSGQTQTKSRIMTEFILLNLFFFQSSQVPARMNSSRVPGDLEQAECSHSCYL